MTDNIFSKYVMVPETIFAFKFSDRDGWQIKAWECTQEELLEEIKMTNWKLDDLKVLLEHQVIKGLNGCLLNDVAYSQHWLFDPSEEHWMPMDDELNVPDNETISGDIQLSLINIDEGNLFIEAQGPKSTVGLQLSSAQDDLVDLVQFFNLISNGSTPHLVFNGNDFNVLATFPLSGNRIRLRVRHIGSAEDDEPIDIVTSRKKLLSEIKGLADNIANHPDLACGWFGLDEDSDIEDVHTVEQYKSALSALDSRFIDNTYASKVKKNRKAAFNQKMLDAAHDNLIDEDESDNQGQMFQLAIRQEGHEGWDRVSFVKSPKTYLQACVDDGLKIVESQVICEYRGRPVHKGIFYFGHSPSNFDEGWKYDRFHQCWRAPNEEIKTPAWSIPKEELQRRETHLKAVVPSLTKWTLKIFNQDNVLVHDEEKKFTDTDTSISDVHKFNWGIGEYAESLGLIHGPFTSIWKIFYEVSGKTLKFSEHHRSLEKIADEWEVKYMEGPDRNKPLIKIVPDYIGSYAWDENGTSIGIDYQFPDFPDLKLVEAVLADEWQIQFECAKEIDEEGTLDLNWGDFHKQGLELAFRLKAILEDRADIVYEKPYEDPNQKVDKTRFILFE